MRTFVQFKTAGVAATQRQGLQREPARQSRLASPQTVAPTGIAVRRRLVLGST